MAECSPSMCKASGLILALHKNTHKNLPSQVLLSTFSSLASCCTFIHSTKIVSTAEEKSESLWLLSVGSSDGFVGTQLCSNSLDGMLYVRISLHVWGKDI